jgi:hypothetical protein
METWAGGGASLRGMDLGATFGGWLGCWIARVARWLQRTADLKRFSFCGGGDSGCSSGGPVVYPGSPGRGMKGSV